MSLPDLGEVYLDHIAVATKDLESSVSIFTKLGLNFSEDREVVEDQKVKTAFAKIDKHANLELLEPINNEGPIQKYIEKKGEGIHHLCFRVDDVNITMNKLKKEGFVFIYEKPKVGAHNCLINFIHPKSTGGILIEVSQKQE
jgi:methylmalonyl-CoA/ethylmalonyl-CoA epimerase